MAELERVEDAGVAERANRGGKEQERVVLERHRALLYGRGEERGQAEDGGALKKGFTREAAQQVVAEGGRVPGSVCLRCRVRYFTEGGGDR